MQSKIEVHCGENTYPLSAGSAPQSLRTDPCAVEWFVWWTFCDVLGRCQFLRPACATSDWWKGRFAFLRFFVSQRKRTRKRVAFGIGVNHCNASTFDRPISKWQRTPATVLIITSFCIIRVRQAGVAQRFVIYLFFYFSSLYHEKGVIIISSTHAECSYAIAKYQFSARRWLHAVHLRLFFFLLLLSPAPFGSLLVLERGGQSRSVAGHFE